MSVGQSVLTNPPLEGPRYTLSRGKETRPRWDGCLQRSRRELTWLSYVRPAFQHRRQRYPHGDGYFSDVSLSHTHTTRTRTFMVLDCTYTTCWSLITVSHLPFHTCMGGAGGHPTCVRLQSGDCHSAGIP